MSRDMLDAIMDQFHRTGTLNNADIKQLISWALMARSIQQMEELGDE